MSATFDELVHEGLSLIPAHAPDWTNHNPSDPGITLVELLAYFTEVLAYRLGRVTPQAKLQFLRLLQGAGWTGWTALEGGPAEAIDRALDDAVRALGHHQCAVTAADFEQLAVDEAKRELQGAPVRALCLAGVDLQSASRPGPRDLRAHVSVVLVPRREVDPHRMTKVCAAVRDRLRPRCLLGTRLQVVGPAVLHVGIGLRVALRTGADWHDVRLAIEANLRSRYGPWDDDDAKESPRPGMPLNLSEITRLVDDTDGVDYVEEVSVRALGRDADALHEPASAVGVQIGIHSTLAVDAWLGASGEGAERLERDEAGRLATVRLQSWEVLRLHVMVADEGSRDGR
jgi:hypothetical protein